MNACLYICACKPSTKIMPGLHCEHADMLFFFFRLTKKKLCTSLGNSIQYKLHEYFFWLLNSEKLSEYRLGTKQQTCLAERFLGTAAEVPVYFCLFGVVPPSDGIAFPARTAAPYAISAPECSVAQREQAHCPKWGAGRKRCTPGAEDSVGALSHLCYALCTL